jgi:hypothetical protein
MLAGIEISKINLILTTFNLISVNKVEKSIKIH